MFEKSLQSKFSRIFELKKVSFDLESTDNEQECLFIQVDSTNAKISDGKASCKVMGKAAIYAQGDKLPFGYFAKKINAASLDDTRDLFFYDIDESIKTFQNIARRSFSFVYFFNSQYDPELGTITSINTQVTT